MCTPWSGYPCQPLVNTLLTIQILTSQCQIRLWSIYVSLIKSSTSLILTYRSNWLSLQPTQSSSIECFPITFIFVIYCSKVTGRPRNIRRITRNCFKKPVNLFLRYQNLKLVFLKKFNFFHSLLNFSQNLSYFEQFTSKLPLTNKLTLHPNEYIKTFFDFPKMLSPFNSISIEKF